MTKKIVAALVLASGIGKRFSSIVPKQYMTINDMPIIRHSVMKFISHPNINKVLVVINQKHIALAETSLNGLDILPFTFGGQTRQISVLIGLRELYQYKPKKVIIHDAVRPNITTKQISQVIENIIENYAIVPAINISDTLIHKKNNMNINYKNRKHYRQIQTPQGFMFDEILEKHNNTKFLNLGDDSELYNLPVSKIKIIKGSKNNIKITNKDDLFLLRKIIKKQYLEITGLGFDVHKFSPKPTNTLRLGGINIKYSKKLEGHSDADVVLHAITDSILGIVKEGDIGRVFSNKNPKWKNADSKIFLDYAIARVKQLNYIIRYIDITIICEEPKISSHANRMTKKISELVEISTDNISIKATTTEELGITGRKEGIAAKCLTTISKPIKSES